MKVEIVEYVSRQRYNYIGGGLVAEGSPLIDRDTFVTLFKGDIEEPEISIFDRIYLEGLSKLVTIQDIVRGTSGKFLYLTDSMIFLTEEVPNDILLKQKSYQDNYSKYDDEYLTDFLEGLLDEVLIPNKIINKKLIKKYKKWGVKIDNRIAYSRMLRIKPDKL